MTDITFTALDLGISDEDRQTIYNEVMSTPEEKWHFNEFRGCYMLPVFNAGGQLGGQTKGKDTKSGEFAYTEPAKDWTFTQNLLNTSKISKTATNSKPPLTLSKTHYQT